jgi:hypothetical protein
LLACRSGKTSASSALKKSQMLRNATAARLAVAPQQMQMLREVLKAYCRHAAWYLADEKSPFAFDHTKLEDINDIRERLWPTLCVSLYRPIRPILTRPIGDQPRTNC